jgi:hypothetical protein
MTGLTRLGFLLRDMRDKLLCGPVR